MPNYDDAMQILNNIPASAAPIVAPASNDFDTKMNMMQMASQGKLPAPIAKPVIASLPIDTGAQPVGGALAAASDNASNMMTFGLSKYAGALGAATAAKIREPDKSFGDLYNTALSQTENRQKAQNEASPNAAMVGDVAGFVGSMATALPQKVAAQVPRAWNTIKTLGESARNNAILGSAIGEANAIGNTQGSMEDKVAAAAPAGSEGAALGAAVPLAAQGILSTGGKIIAPLINKLTKSDMDVAVSKLAKRFAQDNNITPQQAEAALANISPEASLADVGGTNVQKLGRTTLNTPGVGANNTANFLNNRQADMGQRVGDIIKTGFGSDAEFNDTIANLQAAQQERAAPHYKAFYAANTNMVSPEINRIIDTPAGNSAFKQAVTDMQNSRSNVSMSDPELVEQARLAGTYVPGSGGISSGLKGETLDYMKQAMDDQISSAYRLGNNRQAGNINKLKNDLLKEMDALDVTAKAGPKSFKPEGGNYVQGRSAYSGPAQSLEALQMGRGFMNEDSQVTANEVAKLSDADKHIFQIGAARAIADKAMANPSSTVRNVINNNLWRQKLKAALPSDKHYYDFMANAQNEANMQATRSAVMGNSSTASQLKDMAEENGSLIKMPYDLNVGNIIDASQGNIKGAAVQVGKHYINKLMAPKPAVSENLSNMLFSKDPQQNAQTIAAWQQYLQKNQPQQFNVAPQLNPFGWQASRIAN